MSTMVENVQNNAVKKQIIIALLILMLNRSAFTGKTVTLTTEFIDSNIPRAASAVPVLRSMMKDPASFVLEGVYLKAPNKKGISDICFAFRSHNSYGGYSGSSTARLNSKDVVDELFDGEMASSVFNSCSLFLEDKWINITTKVNAALAPPPPPTAAPIATAPPEPTPAPAYTRADRPGWVKTFNDEMRKQNTVAYAEISGDVLTVHSEQTSSLRFHTLLVNNSLMDHLRQMGLTAFVYTNDADLKLVYDLVKNAEVKQ